MPYRICLISLGCAKNQVNSEQMLYLLRIRVVSSLALGT